MLKIIKLSKRMGNEYLFKNLSFEVNNGEKVAIIGPSGIGKSTLLRCIAGIESFEGNVSLDGNLTLVFQEFNLFPHLNVWDNISYAPLKVQKKSEHDVNVLGKKLLEEFGIEDLAQKYPSTLSGGQKQRVAMIRAIMTNADCLLMDEPTSSLDVATTEIIANFFKRSDKTILFVTHDNSFIEKVATKVLELSDSETLIDVTNSKYNLK